MKNKIPRNAKKLKVTIKVETPAHKVGDVVIVQKNDYGLWSGGGYAFFLATLRDGDICSVEVLETTN